MARFLHYDRPKGTIHDLAHWLSIPEGDCCVLLLSARTLYLVQNLVAADINFPARFAIQLREDGYYSPSEGEPGWQDFLDASRLARYEVVDMACDISTLLQGIQEALEALQTTMQSQNVTNLLQYSAQQDQSLCCGPASERNYSGSSPSETPNPETSLFCDCCWSFARDWRDATTDILGHWLAGETAGLGILSIITLALDIPLAILVGIVSIITTAILEVTKDDLLAVASDLTSDVACAVYTASDAAGAKAAIDSLLDSYSYPTGWVALATTVLKYLVGYDALNKVFDETYTVRPDSEGSECSCGGGGTLFLQTALTSPFDVIEIGGPVEDYDVKGGSGEWRTGHGHALLITFEALEATSRVRVKFTCYANFPPAVQHVRILNHPAHTLVAEPDPVTITADSGGPYDVYQLDFNCSLANGNDYDIEFQYDASEENWFWKISVEKIS
jgi:hypothetical protein